MKQILGMMMLCLALFCGCRPSSDTGMIEINVDYAVNGEAMEEDTLKYVNAAGNHFMVTEVQWFISHLEFQNRDGVWVSFNSREDTGDNAVHYFDTDLPETHHLQLEDVPQGHYKALRFTFGLNEADNISGRFPNTPESNMFWPEPLGGGYHYMKLNGRWRNANDELVPFNVHLGIGQNSELTEFYPNYFNVSIPIDLNVKPDSKATLRLTMVIDNWFQSPNNYDFNDYGGSIMQNQEAQQVLKENGHDVFTASTSSLIDNIAKPVKDIIHAASPKPHFFTKENIGNLLSDIRKNKKP